MESRCERFRSPHGPEDSRHRVEEALKALRPARAVDVSYEWEEEEGDPVLVTRFAPPARTTRFLKALSGGMAMLVAASAWAMVSPQASGAVVVLLPMITVLAILGFPILVLALASNRAAEEATIRRTLRAALQDAEER